MTPLDIFSALLSGLFLLFLLRAISMFVRVQKMPESAERTNMRARAQTQTRYAALCLIISFALNGYTLYQAANAPLAP